jgi:UDP-glucose-4-epimerase GalE
MRALVTGGAGYIGSHACQRLLADGHTVIAMDSLFRGHRAPMDALKASAGDRFGFVHADVGEAGRVRAVVDEHDLDTVLHFGAAAYVGESVDEPLWYYRNNIASAVGMLEALDGARGGRGGKGVERIIFSSSCATYGDPPAGMIPVPETCPQNPTSPYGRTKLHFEHILLDYAEKRAREKRPLALTMLRYFNVAGSDRTGLLGEDHTPETHLVPVAIQAAQGKRDSLSIFGTDYPTPDGTCVRDYVHVEDLIDAHVRAAERVKPGQTEAFNVGIGKGYSVREILDSVRRVTGKDFAVNESGRRAGDAIALYNDPTKIQRELGWQAQVTDIDAIVGTAWAWMSANPNGYPKA